MALNPDILATLAAHSTQRPALVVGFAAETEKVVEHAVAKRARKGCDWIVANDVSGDVMGGDANPVHLVTERWRGGLAEDAEGRSGASPGARIAARFAHEPPRSRCCACRMPRACPCPPMPPPGAAGMDLLAAVAAPVTIAPGGRALVPTGPAHRAAAGP